MAYFHCLIGGGSSGGGYELTVTCDADFAGTTITCTDGVTTLTQTCPSASPYNVVFEIPNSGDWTISGVVGGHTVSTGVNIPTSASLIATIQQTVTIHSAKEDTISYTDIDGATQTITFASGATSKQVQIMIEPNGSSITFTSSVAKNPDNLSQDYSKTFTITTSTTDIYLMPDTVKTLYWWGYESSDLEDMNTANGWVHNSRSFGTPTHNTNDIQLTANASNVVGIGVKNQVSPSSAHVITNSVTGGTAFCLDASKNMTSTTSYKNVTVSGSSLTKTDMTSITNSGILYVRTATSSYSAKINALWYE